MGNKTKLFLAAYVNAANAQNINCDHIARFVNKERFEVHALYIGGDPVDKASYEAAGIRLHRMVPHRWVWFWGKLWHMWRSRCDVYYLPKREKADRFFLAHHARRAKVCSSIEGVVGEQISAKDGNARSFFERCDAVFSIGHCIAKSARSCWNMETPVLYLGVDEPKGGDKGVHEVHEVIWVGSLIARKRPDYLLDLAACFPSLRFTMVGDGDLSEHVARRVSKERLTNVTLTGRVPNGRVYELLAYADLLLMTSDKEGLPKVIGEAMSMGVPAIYINGAYDVDYIAAGENGYAVPDLEAMASTLQLLLDEPETYRRVSRSARESIQPYLWRNVIHGYEDFFEGLVAESQFGALASCAAPDRISREGAAFYRTVEAEHGDR